MNQLISLWKYISLFHSKTDRHPNVSLVVIGVAGAIALLVLAEWFRRGYDKDHVRKSLQKRLDESTKRHPVALRFLMAVVGGLSFVLIWIAVGLLPFRGADAFVPQPVASVPRQPTLPMGKHDGKEVGASQAATYEQDDNGEKTGGNRSARRRFTESIRDFVVIIGGTPHNVSQDRTRKHPANLAPFGDRDAIQAYVEKEGLYVDATLHYAPDKPPLRLIHNELQHRPPDWDRNFDESAIEIVDAKLTPRFQLIYKDPKTVVIRGVFQLPTGAVVFDDNAHFFIGSREDAVRITRLFKYPSRLHQGEELAATPLRTEVSDMSRAPVITQQGQNNIAQVGNNNTANIMTMPPFRSLTEAQRQGIVTFLRSMPESIQVNVGSVYGSGDGHAYAMNMLKAARDANRTSAEIPELKTGFDSEWTGVFVTTNSDTDSAVPYRNRFVDLLNALGITAQRAKGTQIPGGTLYILVGYRREEVTHQ